MKKPYLCVFEINRPQFVPIEAAKNKKSSHSTREHEDSVGTQGGN